MKISFSPYNPTFQSNTRNYYIEDKNQRIGTMSFLFREDFEWKEFSDYIINHFKNQNRVNMVQFAASDGSEAYTQIISLLEFQKNTDKFFPIKAYDIDKEVINAAKSGLINIDKNDITALKDHSIIFEKYFEPCDKKLTLSNDSLEQFTKTYKVSKKLTDLVNFHEADMFNILKTLEDESNTIVMCRNVLGYFSDHKCEDFIRLASQKLKRGSLFVIGLDDYKKANLDRMIQHYSFIPVFKNLYRRR